MIDFILFLGYGKVLQYFAKKFPPVRDSAKRWGFTQELYDCDLCSGVWIYFFLSLFCDIDMKMKNKLVGRIVLACLSSLMAYVFKTGYNELFSKIVIEDAYNSG